MEPLEASIRWLSIQRAATDQWFTRASTFWLECAAIPDLVEETYKQVRGRNPQNGDWMEYDYQMIAASLMAAI